MPRRWAAASAPALSTSSRRKASRHSTRGLAGWEAAARQPPPRRGPFHLFDAATFFCPPALEASLWHAVEPTNERLHLRLLQRLAPLPPLHGRRAAAGGPLQFNPALWQWEEPGAMMGGGHPAPQASTALADPASDVCAYFNAVRVVDAFGLAALPAHLHPLLRRGSGALAAPPARAAPVGTIPPAFIPTLASASALGAVTVSPHLDAAASEAAA